MEYQIRKMDNDLRSLKMTAPPLKVECEGLTMEQVFKIMQVFEGDRVVINPGEKYE